MAGGRILPTGQRLSITEPAPGAFHWRILSRDGNRVLLTAAESYGQYSDANRGAMRAYRRLGGTLLTIDPYPTHG